MEILKMGPVSVVGPRAVTLAAGELGNLGNVYTWGNNNYGQLGIGTSNYNFNSSSGDYRHTANTDRLGTTTSSQWGAHRPRNRPSTYPGHYEG